MDGERSTADTKKRTPVLSLNLVQSRQSLNKCSDQYECDVILCSSYGEKASTRLIWIFVVWEDNHVTCQDLHLSYFSTVTFWSDVTRNNLSTLKQYILNNKQYSIILNPKKSYDLVDSMTDNITMHGVPKTVHCEMLRSATKDVKMFPTNIS